MKSKSLILLIALAAVLLALAKFTSGNRRAKTPPVAGEPVFPSLDLSQVRAVEIAAEGQVLRIEQQGDAWAVTNVFGYPADLARLRPALIALGDLKIGHRQPGGAIDPASATSVAIFGENGAPLAGLVLGGMRESTQQQATPYGMMGMGADGRYISRADSSDVFLVKETLGEFVPSAMAWIDPSLLSVPAADLARIEMAAPDGATLAFDRSSGTLEMEGLAEGEEFDASKSYGIESAFAYLRLSGVADPALDDAATGLADDDAHRFAATTKDGTTYTATIGATVPGGSDRYLRLDIDPGTNAVPAGLAAKRKLFETFTFHVPAHAAQNMVRSRTDLLKAPPPPAAEAEPPATQPTAQEEE
ncbi:MAG: DUF4340 domain-containing protein [Kiritimatiellia bacterium]|jgi:hypothetical protein